MNALTIHRFDSPVDTSGKDSRLECRNGRSCSVIRLGFAFNFKIRVASETWLILCLVAVNELYSKRVLKNLQKALLKQKANVIGWCCRQCLSPAYRVAFFSVCASNFAQWKTGFIWELTKGLFTWSRLAGTGSRTGWFWCNEMSQSA